MTLTKHNFFRDKHKGDQDSRGLEDGCLHYLVGIWCYCQRFWWSADWSLIQPAHSLRWPLWMLIPWRLQRQLGIHLWREIMVKNIIQQKKQPSICHLKHASLFRPSSYHSARQTRCCNMWPQHAPAPVHPATHFSGFLVFKRHELLTTCSSKHCLVLCNSARGWTYGAKDMKSIYRVGKSSQPQLAQISMLA